MPESPTGELLRADHRDRPRQILFPGFTRRSIRMLVLKASIGRSVAMAPLARSDGQTADMDSGDGQPHEPARQQPWHWGYGRVRAEGLEFEAHLPAWLRPSGPENRLPVAAAIVVAVGLQLAIPDKYGLHPRWLIPALDGAAGGAHGAQPCSADPGDRGSASTRASRGRRDHPRQRLLRRLPRPRHPHRQGSGDATGLLASGAAIYLTNIIAFGIWYWELDRGGPFARAARRHRYPDFLFPQMANPELAPPHWAPAFPRLPLRQLHQRHRVLPHRHPAAVAVGEDADGRPERRRAIHHGAGHRPRRERPEIGAATRVPP